MKNWLKITRALDHKRNKNDWERLEEMMKVGNYPLQFSYPLILQLEVTGECNLSCKHCYNRSGDLDRISETCMNAEDWKNLAHQIVRDGGIFQCIISGGEPLLLGENLFEIMDILHEDGTSFVIITNGFLLTKEKVRRLAKYRYFWFQVSIDGATAEEHDKFRGVTGSFERAVKGALEISQHGIPLVIAHSVTPDTLASLEKMVQLAIELGASSLIIGDVMPSGRALSQKGIMLSENEKNIMLEKISELNKKYQGKIMIDRSMDVYTSMERYVNVPNTGGIIRPNGDFRLDCMVPFTVGNVLKNSIKDIWTNKGINAWNNSKVQNYISSIDKLTQCGNYLNHVDSDIQI